MKIKKDGNMWCITADDFTNLQESEAVFVTEEEYQSFKAKQLIEELEYWAKFFEDDSMTSLTPSKRLRQRIEQLQKKIPK